MAVKHEILINVTSQETRVAIVENGILQELYLERMLARGIVGNIYKGKVARVLPGMQAAFVDIGLDKNGFLHAADIVRRDATHALRKRSAAELKSDRDTPLIQSLVRPGESVWVQAVKDPTAGKGARLTTELSISSRNLVYLPLHNEIGISQKIESVEERARLIALVQEQVPKYSLLGGFIIRTLAESADTHDITNDLAFLEKAWNQIVEVMQQAQPASLVYSELPLALRAIRDLVSDEVEIRIDSQASLDWAIEFARDFVPQIADKIKYHSGESALFDSYSIEEEIQKALLRKVMLDSGGDLIIDQTEAMTTIDVNTGSYVGHHDHDDTLFKTNLEAAGEIARQLRLRNSSGIIIIDFIDMVNIQHRQQILNALETALARDRVKTRITQMSSLGLVEITRQRTRPSLAQSMCESCAVCEGRGSVKTVHTVCYEILRDLLCQHRKFKARGYTILACDAVIERMLDQEANSLDELQKFIDSPINLQVEPHYQQQQYAIALN